MTSILGCHHTPLTTSYHWPSCIAGWPFLYVDVSARFVYNENGLRVRKTVNGVVTNYTLQGKNIVHMTPGSNDLHFFYDAQNRPAVVVYNGTPYSYVKNLQGDIVAILNSAGTVVVSYVYDAWGRPISCSGTMANTLGKINPFRYRGYVYDEETELYYLRSRYYSLTWCRFISIDMLISAARLYAYCDNNPLNYSDANGLEKDYMNGLRRSDTRHWYYAIHTTHGKLIPGEGYVPHIHLYDESSGEYYAINADKTPHDKASSKYPDKISMPEELARQSMKPVVQ